MLNPLNLSTEEKYFDVLFFLIPQKSLQKNPLYNQ